MAEIRAANLEGKTSVDTQRLHRSRGRQGNCGQVPGGEKAPARSAGSSPAGQFTCERPALVVVKQWRRPAAAARCAGRAARSSSPGRDAGGFRPDEGAGKHTAAPAAAAARSTPAPARGAALAALPGPAWNGSKRGRRLRTPPSLRPDNNGPARGPAPAASARPRPARCPPRPRAGAAAPRPPETRDRLGARLWPAPRPAGCGPAR